MWAAEKGRAMLENDDKSHRRVSEAEGEGDGEVCSPQAVLAVRSLGSLISGWESVVAY